MAGLIKRGKKYYAVYYVGKKQKRVSLDTESQQIAKELKRQLESSLYRGEESPLPTKTPIATVVTNYIEYMKTRKTARSVERDTYYLRETFGPICPALTLKNPKISQKGKKCPSNYAAVYIEANCFEQLTTPDFVNFISTQVRRKGLKPKTANRYREVLTRLFNWAMESNGIRMPRGKNPVAKVERYRERAPEITFLSLEQIDVQLKSLSKFRGLQVIVALYIYAGLRREELCWLTMDDIDCSAGGTGMIRVRAKTIDGRFWEPKTKVNRVVPISSTLKKFLDSYDRPKEDAPWYFPSPEGKRWDPDNLSRAIRAANDQAGLNWSCLDYRHTFGSQLAMKGESLYKISKMMGNSPEICRKHYAALIPESLVDSVEFREVQPKPPAKVEQLATDSVPLERPQLRLVVNNK